MCNRGVFEMNIDLNSFERELAIDEKIPSGEIDLDSPNARLDGEVSLTGNLAKSAASTALKGRLSGELEIDCDRCLEPQKSAFEIALDVEFVPESDFGSDANLELQSEDMKLDAIAGNSIDLAEIAREQILLEIPQQFFCREDCKGLCPKCGANLNLIDCDCRDTEIDPRWAALKNLN